MLRSFFILTLISLLFACGRGGFNNNDTTGNTGDNNTTVTEISISPLSMDDFRFEQDVGERSDKVVGSMDFYLLDSERENYIRDLSTDNMEFLVRNFGSSGDFTEEVEATKASEINTTPINIHYLIDVSYSVVEAQANDELITRANELVNNIRQINAETSTSDVTYRTFGDIISPLITSNLSNPFDALEFEGKGGGTALYQAIQLALEDLESSPDSVLFVFTDGKENASASGFNIDKIIQTATASGIPIYLTALGDDVDTEALNKIATDSEGSFFQALDKNTLEQAFQNILNRIPVKYTAVYRPTQRSGHVEFQFKVTYNGVSTFITDDFDVDAILNPE